MPHLVCPPSFFWCAGGPLRTDQLSKRSGGEVTPTSALEDGTLARYEVGELARLALTERRAGRGAYLAEQLSSSPRADHRRFAAMMQLRAAVRSDLSEAVRLGRDLVAPRGGVDFPRLPGEVVKPHLPTPLPNR
jgi:hypothetical protein